jgi:hypothetical protein
MRRGIGVCFLAVVVSLVSFWLFHGLAHAECFTGCGTANNICFTDDEGNIWWFDFTNNIALLFTTTTIMRGAVRPISCTRLGTLSIRALPVRVPTQTAR